MILGLVKEVSGQNVNSCYIQIAVSMGDVNAGAECYIDPSDTIENQHAIIAAACRTILGADSEEPVRLFGAAVELA